MITRTKFINYEDYCQVQKKDYNILMRTVNLHTVLLNDYTQMVERCRLTSRIPSWSINKTIGNRHDFRF